MSDITTYQFVDAEGHPEGGQVYGTGFCIAWQRGPLGRDAERVVPNGAFVEDIIKAVIGRIEFYNDNGFHCDENDDALEHLHLALAALQARTARREAEGTEGTWEGT